MNLKGKKVLVAGGSGFIGSHLVEELVRQKAKVRVLVPYSLNRNEEDLVYLDRDVKSKLDIVFGTISEIETAKHAMKDIDIAFNLAALVGIPYSYVHPREVFEVNTLGTLNMLTAAREFKVKKFIQTSTSEVYGSAKYVPIDENHPLQPQSPYSASKISSDAFSLSFFYSFNLPVIVIRPFNTFGPRQSERAVIPTIITQALTGDSISIGSLSPRRDFTYVKDTVNGFIKAAYSNKGTGEVINLGTGKDHTIGETIEIIQKILGRKLKVNVSKERIRPEKSEVRRLQASNKKAGKLLNWKPEYTFEEGLKETIEFIKNNLGRYNPNKYII